MKILDANVLIGWHRNDHPHHHAVKQWCDHLLATDEPFGAADLAWVAFLRVATNPKAFKTPSPLVDVFAFRSAVEQRPTCVPIASGPRHWQIMERVGIKHRASANLVNDAYLAAIAIEHGAELVSIDGDFGRFHELRWIDPLAL